MIALIARDAKYKADKTNNITLISSAFPENKGIINLLVLAGKLNVINSAIESNDNEKACAITPNIKIIGIDESNKKKDRCPGKTDITGFPIISIISLKNCIYLLLSFFMC